MTFFCYFSRLVEDTAWHPVMRTEVEKWTPAQSTLYKTFLGSPLKLWASVGHWWIWHFDLSKYTEKQKPRVSMTSRTAAPDDQQGCCQDQLEV